MRLRRLLDRRYEEGLRDGRRGVRRNPSRTEGFNRYGRWAYEAGHRDGQHELAELRRVLADPDQGIPTVDVS